MSPEDLHAAAHELTTLDGRFAPLFGRKESRAQSLIYLKGLVAGQGEDPNVRGEPPAIDNVDQEVQIRKLPTAERFSSTKRS